MNFLYQLLEFLKKFFDFLFVVEPWEQAVRVRAGKHLRLFGAGIHPKLPFFDRVYGQNVRRRVLALGVQTTTTRDGQCVTINGSLGYRITDVLKLHQTLHDAEGSVLQEVSGKVQRYIAEHDAVDCTPEKIMRAVAEVLPLEHYGLGDCDFFLSGYIANIPAVRLIQETMGGHFGGRALDTNNGYGGSAPVSAPGYR